MTKQGGRVRPPFPGSMMNCLSEEGDLSCPRTTYFRHGPCQGNAFRPPFSFRLAEKKTGRGRSKRKGRFFLTNQESPGHETEFSAAFALVVAAPSLSALPASLRAGAAVKGFNSPPHHGQQEEKRSNCSPVLASQFLQAGRRSIESAEAGRCSFYRYGMSKKPLHDPSAKSRGP